MSVVPEILVHNILDGISEFPRKRINLFLISYSFIGDIILGILVRWQKIIDLIGDFVIQYATECKIQYKC